MAGAGAVDGAALSGLGGAVAGPTGVDGCDGKGALFAAREGLVAGTAAAILAGAAGTSAFVAGAAGAAGVTDAAGAGFATGAACCAGAEF